MGDPVSWLLIEPGWRVVDANGEGLGHIEAVTGDSSADIFDGIAFATGLFARPRYAPAEHVGTIENGVVHLTIAGAAVSALGEYGEPAESIDIEPGAASHLERAEEAVLAQDPRDHREGIVRRVAAWFGLAGRR
jgi:hypothetical protein